MDSLKGQVMNINWLTAVTLGIEMALNGLDICLTVAVSLGTIIYTNSCDDDTILIDFLADNDPMIVLIKIVSQLYY